MANIDVVLRQRRFTQTASGLTKYKIALSVTKGGTPTHTPGVTSQVFVMTLKTAEADDTFARVATIADLDLVVGQRYVAVENSATEYRTASITLTFTDLDTGVAAIPVIKDRVNSLVSTWNTAQTDFVHVGDDYDLPEATTSTTVEAAAQVGYTDARTARTETEAAQVLCQADYTAAQTDAADKLVLRDLHKGYWDEWVVVDGLADPAVDALSAASTALVAASQAIARTTRVELSGTITTANGNTNVHNTASPFGSISAGDLVAVTLAASGKIEVRTISAVAPDELTVHQAFSSVPWPADTYEVRILNDFLAGNDFGATSAAADAATAAYAEVTKAAGLRPKIDEFRVAAGSAYSTAGHTYDAAVVVEGAELSQLNDCKADKDVAQTKENAALADLQAVCPRVDVAAL